MKYQVNRGKTCIVSGCNNKAKVKGLCMACYQKRKILRKVIKHLLIGQKE